MAEDNTPQTVTVRISSEAPGGRTVNTTSGQIVVRPGTTTDPVELLVAEATDLPDGLTAEAVDPSELDAPEAPAADESDGAGTTQIPADLANASSSDGMVLKDKMLDVAKAEGVTLDGTETKADLLAKIVAKRSAS